jgi:hypothetical protein
VLDHLGLPDIRAQQLAPWESGLKELAAYLNVYCKLSGLAYRADWQRWRAAEFAPYLDIALEMLSTSVGKVDCDRFLEIACGQTTRGIQKKPADRLPVRSQAGASLPSCP